MSNKDQKAIKVGIAATVVGAAAGAAGMYLSDKKNRQKAAKQLDKAKRWSDDTLDKLKDKVDDLHVDDKVDNLKQKTKHKSEELKDQASDALHHAQQAE